MRACLFHFNLDITLRRVHIVELLFTTFASVIFIHGRKELFAMKNPAHALHSQPQLIRTCIDIFV